MAYGQRVVQNTREPHAYPGIAFGYRMLWALRRFPGPGVRRAEKTNPKYDALAPDGRGKL